jgi:hypothetical protein
MYIISIYQPLREVPATEPLLKPLRDVSFSFATFYMYIISIYQLLRDVNPMRSVSAFSSSSTTTNTHSILSVREREKTRQKTSERASERAREGKSERERARERTRERGRARVSRGFDAGALVE